MILMMISLKNKDIVNMKNLDAKDKKIKEYSLIGDAGLLLGVFLYLLSIILF